MESNKTQNWYSRLIEDCNSLAERFGLDDFHVDELRKFVEKIARDQFISGSKSGYRWAKQGGEKKLATAPQAVAA